MNFVNSWIFFTDISVTIRYTGTLLYAFVSILYYLLFQNDLYTGPHRTQICILDSISFQ